MKKCGIYRITNIQTGDIYIGSSVDIAKRWYKHRKALNTATHVNQRLQRAWDKYGAAAFNFEIVEICVRSQLTAIEQQYITSEQPTYNLATDAAHPMLGRHHSPATIAKMRATAAAQGRKPSEEAVRKSATSRLGKPGIRLGSKHKEETIQLYKEQRKGKNFRRKGAKGHPITPENLEKLLAGQRAWRLRKGEEQHDDPANGT